MTDQERADFFRSIEDKPADEQIEAVRAVLRSFPGDPAGLRTFLFSTEMRAWLHKHVNDIHAWYDRQQK